MGFVNERVPGLVPDFGAIFMSNSVTRMECFKRKLFGLPASHASFVRQVKAGMVLFLFEFDRRQLHGVFQACSDGAMNIVPHAFSSSGKQFPAQIKFSTIWKCDPLSEHEFCDAIKDNYFSANKFNFGLSEDQVQLLLLLFSQRKLKRPLPPRQLMRSRVTEPPRKALRKIRGVVRNDKFVLSDKIEIEDDTEPVSSTEYSRYSMGKERRVSDDDRYPTRYRVGNNEHLVDDDFELSMLTEYSGHTFCREKTTPDDGRHSTTYELGKKCSVGNEFDLVGSRKNPGKDFGEVRRVAVDGSFITDYKAENNGNFDNGHYHGNPFGEERRVTDDGKFAVSDRFENEHNLENGLNLDISGSYLGKVKRVADDGWFRTSGRLENVSDLDSGLGPAISTVYSNLFQSSLNDRVYSGNRSLEINSSLVQDQIMPSAFSRSMDPWISKLSYSRVHGDATNSSPVPYDPDAPSFQYERSSNFVANQISDFVNECIPPDINAFRNVYPSLKNQSFQLPLQPKALSKHPYVTSGVENYPSFSGPNNCKCTYCMAGIPSSRAGYSENKAVNRPDYEGSENLSLSKSSLASMLVGRSGSQGLKDRGLSYSPSPIKNPYFISDDGQSVSDEKHEHKTPCHESNEALSANFRLPNRSQRQLQGGLGSLESKKKICKETRGFNHNVEYHPELKGVVFDIGKKRNSVFSRLTVAPKVSEQENDINMDSNDDDMDISVDEVMGMLHRGHHCWVNKARKYSVFVRQAEDGKSYGDKRHTPFCNQKLRNDSIGIPKEMNLNLTSANREDLDSVDQGRPPIVDFKRRSQVRKKVELSPSRGCVSNSENKASLSNQPKRRKLVRPDFRNNDLFNDNGDGDNCTCKHGLSLGTSVIKDNTDSSEALFSSQACVHSLSQCVELLHAIGHTDSGGNNIDSGDSKCEAEREIESCEEETFIGGGDLDKNGGSKREAERKSVSCESGVENGQDLLQNVVMNNMPSSVSCEVKSHNTDEGSSGKDIVVSGLFQDHNNTCSSDEQKSSLQLHEGDAMSGIALTGINPGAYNEEFLSI